MSSVNYGLKERGVRLISAEDAWVKGKNGKRRLSPEYRFIGKMHISMPNILVTADDRKRPTYKADVAALNTTAKKEIVAHFYDEKGQRNKRRVAYFGISKTKTNKKEKRKS